MTFIQIVLTLGLTIFFLYGMSHKEMIGILRIALSIVPLIGVVLVWNPDMANVIATSVGIGRGADLMLYFWVVISLIVGVNLHIRLHVLQRKIVLITRSLAILETDIGSDIDGTQYVKKRRKNKA